MIQNLLRSKTGKGFVATMFAMLVLFISLPAFAAGPVSFDGVSLPFTVGDMVGTTMNFLAIFDTWVLLGLGAIFLFVMVGIIFWIVGVIRKRTAKA